MAAHGIIAVSRWNSKHISPIGCLVEKWCNHLVNLFRFLTFQETTWDGHIEYVDQFLVLFRGNSSFHADIVFTKISLADVRYNHGLMAWPFYGCSGICLPVISNFGDGRLIGCNTTGRFITSCSLWTSIGSKNTCLVI